MLFRLVVEKKGKRTRVVEVRTGVAHIGRAHGNEVRIPASDVSRRHCRVKDKGGLLMVEDLESVNGTYLNGDLITGEAVIRPGDHLEVGPVKFVVEYELTSKALMKLMAMDDEPDESARVEEVIELEEFADEETDERPKKKIDLAALDEEDILEVEEVIEDDEEREPLVDLDGVTWKGSNDGDLRDLLTHLDEGQESLLPKKRPAPRKPPGKGDKKRPKPEE
jgi:pSer/pThr/pTyr-binding forkhead associated (FHA) protein